MTSGELTIRLASEIRELGEARAAAIQARTDAWRETAYLPVTERREECRAQTSQLDAEVVKLEAEVEALRVELDQAHRIEDYHAGKV